MKPTFSILKHFGFRQVRTFKSFNHINHRSISSNSVGIWGACFDQGQPHSGLGSAPQLIRGHGLVKRLEGMGWDVKDYGDIVMDRKNGERSSEDVMEFNRRTAGRVEEVLKEDRVCLTLGGDHSVGLGTLAGHLAKDPEAVVLWVDAHADINTMKSSGTGNMHGMPVSFNIEQLQEENLSSLPSSSTSWLTPRLPASRIAYLGLRDVDGPEWEIISSLGIKAFSMRQIDQLGVREALRLALEAVDPHNNRNIHLSFDIDVLDPIEAPSTGTRVRGGLTVREAVTLVEDVAASGRLKAMDLVEVNPSLGSEEEVELTVGAAVEVIMAGLGNRRDGGR